MKKYIFICVIHKLNFEEVEDEKEGMFFVECHSNDLETAQEEVKKKLYSINSQIDNSLFLSCNSLYTGTKKVKTIPIEKLNYITIKHKSFNLL